MEGSPQPCERWYSHFTEEEIVICSRCYLVELKLDPRNPPAGAGDSGSIPGSGRSSGEGNGSPLQYCCLENPTDRGAWWATVCGSARELDTTEWRNHHHSSFLLFSLTVSCRDTLINYMPVTCLFTTWVFIKHSLCINNRTGMPVYLCIQNE